MTASHSPAAIKNIQTASRGGGYGKPPKDFQFKPGVSGNPKGRPKGVRNFMSDAAEEFGELITIKENGVFKKVSKRRGVLKKLMAKALEGNVTAIAQVLALSPSVDVALQAALAVQSLSVSDQQILDAYRRSRTKYDDHDTG